MLDILNAHDITGKVLFYLRNDIDWCCTLLESQSTVARLVSLLRKPIHGWSPRGSLCPSTGSAGRSGSVSEWRPGRTRGNWYHHGVVVQPHWSDDELRVFGSLAPILAVVHWDCTPKLEIITVRLAPNTPKLHLIWSMATSDSGYIPTPYEQQLVMPSCDGLFLGLLHYYSNPLIRKPGIIYSRRPASRPRGVFSSGQQPTHGTCHECWGVTEETKNRWWYWW